MIEVRRARAQDSEAAGRLQVDAWRFTYAGFFSEEYLGSLLYENYAAEWRTALAENHPRKPRWVAYLNGELVGILIADLPKLEVAGFPNELRAIYTKPGLQRAGIGRALFAAYIAWLRENGETAFHLWAGAQNTRAHAFYEAMGGRRVAERSDREFGGKRPIEWAFGWDGL